MAAHFTPTKLQPLTSWFARCIHGARISNNACTPHTTNSTHAHTAIRVWSTDFVRKSVQGLDISENEMHVGLIAYTGVPYVVLPFDSTFSQTELDLKLTAPQLKCGEWYDSKTKGFLTSQPADTTIPCSEQPIQTLEDASQEQAYTLCKENATACTVYNPTWELEPFKKRLPDPTQLDIAFLRKLYVNNPSNPEKPLDSFAHSRTFGREAFYLEPATTNYHRALSKLEEMLTTTKYGRRLDAPAISIFVTDGDLYIPELDEATGKIKHKTGNINKDSEWDELDCHVNGTELSLNFPSSKFGDNEICYLTRLEKKMKEWASGWPVYATGVGADTEKKKATVSTIGKDGTYTADDYDKLEGLTSGVINKVLQQGLCKTTVTTVTSTTATSTTQTSTTATSTTTTTTTRTRTTTTTATSSTSTITATSTTTKTTTVTVTSTTATTTSTKTTTVTETSTTATTTTTKTTTVTNSSTATTKKTTTTITTTTQEFDCVYTISPCTQSCEIGGDRVLSVARNATGVGRICLAQSDVPNCQPGDGQCPATTVTKTTATAATTPITIPTTAEPKRRTTTIKATTMGEDQTTTVPNVTNAEIQRNAGSGNNNDAYWLLLLLLLLMCGVPMLIAQNRRRKDADVVAEIDGAEQWKRDSNDGINAWETTTTFGTPKAGAKKSPPKQVEWNGATVNLRVLSDDFSEALNGESSTDASVLTTFPTEDAVSPRTRAMSALPLNDTLELDQSQMARLEAMDADRTMAGVGGFSPSPVTVAPTPTPSPGFLKDMVSPRTRAMSALPEGVNDSLELDQSAMLQMNPKADDRSLLPQSPISFPGPVLMAPNPTPSPGLLKDMVSPRTRAMSTLPEGVNDSLELDQSAMLQMNPRATDRSLLAHTPISFRDLASPGPSLNGFEGMDDSVASSMAFSPSPQKGFYSSSDGPEMYTSVLAGAVEISQIVSAPKFRAQRVRQSVDASDWQDLGTPTNNKRASLNFSRFSVHNQSINSVVADQERDTMVKGWRSELQRVSTPSATTKSGTSSSGSGVDRRWNHARNANDQAFGNASLWEDDVVSPIRSTTRMLDLRGPSPVRHLCPKHRSPLHPRCLFLWAFTSPRCVIPFKCL